MQMKGKLSYARKKRLYGYGFLALWLVGTLQWFLIPLASSLLFSFRNVTPEAGGMQGPWVGLENYKYALLSDPYYRSLLVEVLWDTLKTTPLILVFSLFIAVLLNQKFRGRVFARAVFFLPVIIATGPVYSVISGNMSDTGTNDAAQFSSLFETDMVGELMNALGIYGLSDRLTAQIQAVTTNALGLVWRSGIQILIFLAALQNIPPSAREAAQMEGANAWAYFWKIILPYVSPMILANLIFTVIDAFASPANPVMARVLATQSDMQYGRSAAMVWLYFVIVMAVVGIMLACVNRFVYYEAE